MALTAAEKMKRYRDKLKKDGKMEDQRLKHRNEQRKSRTKKAADVETLPLAIRLRMRRADNLKAKARNVKCRAKKKMQKADSPKDKLNESPAFKSASTLGKAKAKIKRSLPKSVKKQLFVIRELFIEAGSPPQAKEKKATLRLSAISEEMKINIKEFYERDDISRQAPGRKDVKTVRDGEGVKKKMQTRHLLGSIKEMHALFVKEYGPVIGTSKFAELRPQHVLLSSKLPHNVCLCIYHENFIASVAALHQYVPEFPMFTNNFPELWLCNPPSHKCWLSECSECTDKLKTKLEELDEDLPSQVKWFVWKEVAGRLNKVQEEGSGNELVAYIKSIFSQFLEHCLVKREQSRLYQLEREKVGSASAEKERALLQIDFSENFTCVAQDEVQSAHWNQSQVSLFTAALWHSGKLHSIVYASDHLSHTKDAVIAYLDRLFETIPEYVDHVSIWSDGPSSQFKNRYIATMLSHLEKKHSKTIIWNFFVTSHGKGPVDGIGGAVKRNVWSAVKARKYIVVNAAQFVEAANANSSVAVFNVTLDEIQSRNKDLNTATIFQQAEAIPGIKKCHLMRTSCDGLPLVAQLSSLDVIQSSGSQAVQESPIQLNDWFEVNYDAQLFRGIVTQVDGEEYKVNVMVPVGKNYWKWPEKKDEVFYSRENLIRKVTSPTVVNSRGHFSFS